ncbi:hypothetical protein QR680_001632 [Steinernema hermaphroditum]|uniref:BPTI/Kunitz inhibitor domain-containing protein n=1 Tax=Steinernema hermaphroditum TaxID=289476 RepID=A0AA39LGF4_9BILA|nr:hypothetical protein QR680_001632 [Steinernema hermaphroditum]
MGRLLFKLFCILFHLQLFVALLNYGREGDACNRNDSNWYAVPNSKHHFIFCHPKHGIYVKDKCAMVNGERKIFDAEMQQCVASVAHKATYHPISSLMKCSSSNDCPDKKWFCSSRGTCSCKNEFVQIGIQCWKKVAVNEGECLFDQQCSSIWPTAKCIANKCACPSPFIAVSTYHGMVCTLPEECPMGSKTSVLLKSMNCHVKGGCGTYSNLEHLFDCIHFGPSSPTSMCCPNRAYTCMQPVMPGNGPGKFLRYYYESATDRCISFIFRGGNLINSNVFQSKRECEIYCRSECPRGLVEKSASGQTVRCTKDYECGGRYSCYKQDPNGDGVCCPSREWICSSDGGISYNNSLGRTTEFDAGTALQHVTSVFYPVIRYFYSRGENRCKAFLFQGEGGNFNQFLTMDQCRNFCSSVTCSKDPLIQDGKTVTCTEQEPCVDGYVCTYGICCREKDNQCMPGYEALPKNGPIYGTQSAKECTHNADCPLPYVCQINNNIRKGGNIKGFCCRKMKTNHSKLKPREQVPSQTTMELFSVTTSFREPTSSTARTTLPSQEILTTVTPIETRMIVTIKPVAHCPGNRDILIDDNGAPAICNFETLAASGGLSLGQHCESSANHRCAFVNLNATEGLCCSAMQSYEHRCPDGLVPLFDATSKNVKLCSPLLPSSCQSQNSYCVFDELYGSYHCCRNETVSTTADPATKASTPPTTLPVQTTTIPLTTVTPTTTTTSTTTTSPKIDENYYGCSFGNTAFKDPLTNEPLTCNASIKGSCPPGFDCYFSKSKQQHRCCGLTSVCADNSAAYISPTTSRPVKCSSRSGCPKGFVCYASLKGTTSDEGVCCSEDPVASLCDQGLALRDHEGRAFRCDSSTCPRGYKCTSRFNLTICCPTNENVCHQQFNQGLPCEEAPPQTAFYFDDETKACMEFTFSGCGGNDNRFDSKEDCQSFCKSSAVCEVGMPLLLRDGRVTHCSDDTQCLAGYECTTTISGSYCCPKPEMSCSLPQDPGNECALASPSTLKPHISAKRSLFWHFSMSELACVPFEYLGCGGNFNRFSSQKHCTLSCSHVLCPAGRPKMNGGNIYKCSEHTRCDEGYVCTRASMGQRDVNVCCPKPELLCEDRIEPAAECIDGQIRYKYDSNNNKCIRISNAGCLSTDSSFASRAECDRLCVSSENQCPDDMQPFIDDVHKRVLTCSQEYESCPTGYTCILGKNGHYSYCCADERCPKDKMPLLSSSGEKVICSPGPFGLFDGCPTDYDCYKVATGRQLCCPREKTKDVCRYPSRPFIHTMDGKPMICNEKYSRCPFGYICIENKDYEEHFCCSDFGQITKPEETTSSPTTLSTRPSSESHRCEDGSAPLSDEYGARRCNPRLSFSCPEGYLCEYSDKSEQAFCCRSTNYITDRFFDSKSACPMGMAVRPHPTTNQPIVCQPEVPNYCPRHSQCEYSSLYWQHICCISLSAQEFYDIPNDFPNSKVMYPGDRGCQHNVQCERGDPNSKCHNWFCICPGLLIHNNRCVNYCPSGYVESGGKCV